MIEWLIDKLMKEWLIDKLMKLSFLIAIGLGLWGFIIVIVALTKYIFTI